MTASASQLTPLRFGIEIEIAIQSKRTAHRNWQDIAREVKQGLGDIRIPSLVNGDRREEEEQPYTWSIVTEQTIQSYPSTGTCEYIDRIGLNHLCGTAS